jgi:hypothetical protein
MILRLLSTAFATLLFASIFAQSPTPLQVELQLWNNGLNDPVGIYNAGDDRLFILEQSQGDIELYQTDGTYIGKFLDLSGLISTGGERGLLGLAFPSDYAANGKFYVNYTNNSGNTVIAEYAVSGDPNIADPASASILMTINQDFSNHNGGHIAFGPDGMLYIGMGDGGSGGDPNNRAQNPLSLLGKMLRINPDGAGGYTIPGDNPFVGDGSTLDEIWAVGVRNPWKFSFDQGTGDMWIGDVGQGAWEEIDVQPAASAGGENYGWRCYEGNATYNTSGCGPIGNYVFPEAEYAHGGGDNFCSITGGYVYRGAEFEDMVGHYIFTDYCNGELYSLKDNGIGGYDELIVNGNTNFGYTAFGEDHLGEMYIADIGGAIYKLYDPCDSFTPSITFDGTDFTADAGTDYYWYINDVLDINEVSQTTAAGDVGSYYAVVDDGAGCAKATNVITIGFCEEALAGCTYVDADNYNPVAVIDDGSCTFTLVDPCPADFDDDGLVNAGDLLYFLSQFGSFCP